MDRDLVTFFGAGLQLVASGIVGRPPEGSVRDGFAFVEHLIMFGDNGVQEAIIEVTGQLWSEWKRSRLPRVVAAEHITALPEILEICRVEQGIVLLALAASGATGKDADVAAFKMTSAIIENATREGYFEDANLSRQLTFFFIERLLAQLLVRRSLIKDLDKPVAAYFATYRRRTLEANAAKTGGIFGSDVLGGWQPGSVAADAPFVSIDEIPAQRVA